jgi:hypothetical protein
MHGFEIITESHCCAKQNTEARDSYRRLGGEIEEGNDE